MNAVNFNIKAHDRIAKKYERVHTEIYNEVEQARLRAALEIAVAGMKTGTMTPCALDVGAGAGNLTAHLRDLGLTVTAADISPVFLQLVTEKYPEVATHILNGVDLSEIKDASYDFVATYSVLHHIPDYLKTVQEMCRVLKPGGVLYIDHEKNESYWNNEPALLDFYRSQRLALLPSKLKRLFNPMWYVHRLRRMQNPRYQSEGDIHVWPDDHVQWSEVIATAKAANVHVVSEMDFLLYDANYKKSVYQEVSKSLNDTKVVILRKN
jgi:ubiquinone/menaquinone biosynthesis C-methylase UbiE